MHCLVPYGPVWEHDFFSEAVLPHSSSFVLVVRQRLVATSQSRTSEWQALHRDIRQTLLQGFPQGQRGNRGRDQGRDFPQQMHARSKYKLGSLTSWVLSSFECVVLHFLPFCAHHHKIAEESLHIMCEHMNNSHIEALPLLFSSNPRVLV